MPLSHDVVLGNLLLAPRCQYHSLDSVYALMQRPFNDRISFCREFRRAARNRADCTGYDEAGVPCCAFCAFGIAMSEEARDQESFVLEYKNEGAGRE